MYRTVLILEYMYCMIKQYISAIFCLVVVYSESKFIIFSDIEKIMPKHFRSCDFCSVNSEQDPNVVIFLMNKSMRKVLDVVTEDELYICEKHFKANDIRVHGSTKRLHTEALPVFMPRQITVLHDHDYIPTKQMNMVGCLH